jgi:hypothetical protein
MRSLFAQFGPLLLTLSFVLFSTFVAATPPKFPKEAPKSLTKDKVHAEFPPMNRDPFKVPAPPPEPTPEVEAMVADPLEPRKPEPKLQELIANKTLECTLVTAQRRLAVIQGQLYSEGMPLLEGRSDAFISRIGHDHVVVRKGDEELLIRYGDGTPADKTKQTRTESVDRPAGGSK